MDENFVLVLIATAVLFIIVVFIIWKESKEEKKIKLAEEKQKEENQICLKEIRQKESKEWNKKIQAKFDGKVKYKINKPLKILVGDYTISMAPYTNSILKSMGIETEVVPTASDIIERIKSESHYDLIITNNIYANGERGYTVLEKIKFEEKNDIPIIILTVDQNARKEYISQGFDEYIEKPLDEKKVINVFTKFIDGLEFKKIKSNKSA